jgi:septum formation protein
MLLPFKEKLLKKKTILASSSPRRKQALELTTVFNQQNLTIIPSTFAEDLNKNEFDSVQSYVIETARKKTLEVVNKCIQEKIEFDLLIGADSVVALHDPSKILSQKILEKPNSKEHAFQILKSLSNTKHSVFTAVWICFRKDQNSSEMISFCDETIVHFVNLEDSVIYSYIESGSPFDKAGAYGIQDGMATSFVEKIEGCYHNVTGFPLSRFCRELRKLILDGKLI